MNTIGIGFESSTAAKSTQTETAGVALRVGTAPIQTDVLKGYKN